MSLKRIEECTIDDLFGLFEIEELTMEELKEAKKKVLLLHPDKNIGRNTAVYYEYFKKAFHKLEIIFGYINRHQKEVVSKTYESVDLKQRGFYEYCKQKGVKDKAFQDLFNEVFEKVYIPDNDGHGEWLKTAPEYDKADLEGSRQKAMSLIVVDREIRTLEEMEGRDLKEAYLHSVLPIDAEKVLQDTPRFQSVDAYKRHRDRERAQPVSSPEALKILRQKETDEFKSSLHMSYEILKKTESQSAKMKEVYRNFLRIQSE